MAAFVYHAIVVLLLQLTFCTNALKLSDKPLWEYVDLRVRPRQHQTRRLRGKGPPVHDNLTDPMIGTGGHGHTFPGATVPWGMVQVTPWVHSKNVPKWDTQSGYHSDMDNAEFYGMAHTALSGAGSGEMGELRLLPLGPGRDADMYWDTSAVSATAGSISSYAMPRARSTREARVFIESTAAPRGGVHRFTFRAGEAPSIEVALGPTPDAFWGYKLLEHKLEVVSDRVVEGCLSSQITGIGSAVSLLCFAIEFDRPMTQGQRARRARADADEEGGRGRGDNDTATQFLARRGRARTRRAASRTGTPDADEGPDADEEGGAELEDEVEEGTDENVFDKQGFDNWGKVEAEMPGVVLDFGSGDTVVNAVVGVSRTDLEHARSSLSDLKAEGRSFDGFVASARERWTAALGVVEVEMASVSRMKVLYTALYHSMITPSLLSDADGSYRLQGSHKSASREYAKTGEAMQFKELDEKMPIRRAKNGTHMYSTFSLWDTYRTLHPLMNLIQPEMSRQFGSSLITMAEIWGYLPPWQLIQSPTDMMNGDGGSIILATMARNGIIDKEEALDVVRMIRKAPVDERKYMDQNSIAPDDLPEHVPEHVSRFLEQAKADHCVSSLASDLHEEADAKYFHKRSEVVFGMWNADHEVFSTNNADSLDRQTESFTEGTATQYSWAADWDMEKMLQLRGGKESMACKLDQFFDGSTQHGQEDMSGNLGSASLGNEPTMHTPLLYTRIGYPGRTQYQIDRAVKQLFSDGPDGLPGNDDLGQMSSWVVFLLLGLYPSECSNEYLIGRPFVSTASISIKGNSLVLDVYNQTDANKYVQRAKWEGQELDLVRPGLTFEMLAKGGMLQVWMSSSRLASDEYVCEES